MGRVRLRRACRGPSPVEDHRAPSREDHVRRLQVEVQHPITTTEGGRKRWRRGDSMESVVELGEEVGMPTDAVRLVGHDVEQRRPVHSFQDHVATVDVEHLGSREAVRPHVRHDTRLGFGLLAGAVAAEDPGRAHLEHVRVTPAAEERAGVAVHMDSFSRREKPAPRPCHMSAVVLIYNHMVAGLEEERTGRVFHALADATRRDIVRQAMAGDHSVSALARRYPVSLPAVQKHVAVLEEAGLVTKERRGREQLVRSNVDPIRQAARLLYQFEAVWRGRIDRMREILADDHGGATR